MITDSRNENTCSRLETRFLSLELDLVYPKNLIRGDISKDESLVYTEWVHTLHAARELLEGRQEKFPADHNRYII